jgi:uncharacterized lipoprotein YmbA
MRYAALLMIALAGCASTPTNGDVQLTVAAERVAQCKEAGGCALLSQAEVAALLHQAYMLGAQAAAQQAADMLDSHGCRRGET